MGLRAEFDLNSARKLLEIRIQKKPGENRAFFIIMSLPKISCSRDEAYELPQQYATFLSRAEQQVPSPDLHGSRA